LFEFGYFKFKVPFLSGKIDSFYPVIGFVYKQVFINKNGNHNARACTDY